MSFKGVDNKHSEEFVGVISEMTIRRLRNQDGVLMKSKTGLDRYVLDISFVDDVKDNISQFFAWLEVKMNGTEVEGSHDTYSDAGLLLASLNAQGFDYDIIANGVGEDVMPMTYGLKGQTDVPLVMRPFMKMVKGKEIPRWECVGVGNVGAVTSGTSEETELTPPNELILLAQKVLPMLSETFSQADFVNAVNTVNVPMLEGKGHLINERRDEILGAMATAGKLIKNPDGTYTKTGM